MYFNLISFGPLKLSYLAFGVINMGAGIKPSTLKTKRQSTRLFLVGLSKAICCLECTTYLLKSTLTLQIYEAFLLTYLVTVPKLVST